MPPSKTLQGRYVEPGCRRFFSREFFVGFSLAFSRFPRKGQLPSPPIPKLTLTQTLTLTRVQFSSGAIIWLPPPTLKLTLTLTKTQTLTGGAVLLGGAIVRIPLRIQLQLVTVDNGLKRKTFS